MRRRGGFSRWHIAVMIGGLLVLAAGSVALAGWLLMLAIGALHHEVGWPPSTLSFWASGGIVTAVMVLAQLARGEPIIKVETTRRRW